MCAFQIHPLVLAPFVTSYNSETGVYTADLPEQIVANLENPNLTDEVTPDKVPAHTKFNLIPTHKVGKDAEATIENLIKHEFGTSRWQETVNKVLISKGVIASSKDVAEDIPQYSRFGRDDNLFTVRINNLPDNEGSPQISELLRQNGCDYFERVVIPFDEETAKFKRFGFVKFARLRYALKFIEDHPSIRCGTMLLDLQLVE
jgi:RNA recognition motif-containing protein